VVVSPRSASSSWTTRLVPSSVTSRAQVRAAPNDSQRRANLAANKHMQSARTTSSSYSSPNVRPGVCDKRSRVWRKGHGDGEEQKQDGRQQLSRSWQLPLVSGINRHTSDNPRQLWYYGLGRGRRMGRGWIRPGGEELFSKHGTHHICIRIGIHGDTDIYLYRLARGRRSDL
jgi:hypothetical protein